MQISFQIWFENDFNMLGYPQGVNVAKMGVNVAKFGVSLAIPIGFYLFQIPHCDVVISALDIMPLIVQYNTSMTKSHGLLDSGFGLGLP